MHFAYDEKVFHRDDLAYLISRYPLGVPDKGDAPTPIAYTRALMGGEEVVEPFVVAVLAPQGSRIVSCTHTVYVFAFSLGMHDVCACVALHDENLLSKPRIGPFSVDHMVKEKFLDIYRTIVNFILTIFSMDTKLCSKCQAVKPITEFYKNKTKAKGVSTICKECQKEVTKTAYRANREKYLAQQKEWRKNNPERWKELTEKHKENRRLKLAEQREKYSAIQAERQREINMWLAEYLKSHPCVDCGETDILVLEFDHCDPDDKLNSIAKLRRNLNKLKAEMAKCEVVCCNCHRRRTAKQFGSWRLGFVSD